MCDWCIPVRDFIIGEKDKMEDAAYTYIVECGDGSLYTGWTNHLEERMQCHNAGKGAKYTRSRLPVQLVYYEVSATKQEAMQREWAIKQLKRKDKQLLITGIRKEKAQSERIRKINQAIQFEKASATDEKGIQ